MEKWTSDRYWQTGKSLSGGLGARMSLGTCLCLCGKTGPNGGGVSWPRLPGEAFYSRGRKMILGTPKVSKPESKPMKSIKESLFIHSTNTRGNATSLLNRNAF